MPEITVTVTYGVSPVVVGNLVEVGVGDGFDHAALVTALRSRADAADFRLRHVTLGPVPFVSVAGANTSDCRISFNLLDAGPTTDSGYRLGFGDLGWTISRATAAAGAGPTDTTAAVTSVPDLVLPPPGYDLTEVVRHNVREFATLVSRATVLDEFPAQTLRMQWRNASGETAYTVRAVVAASKGAGTFDYGGFTFRLVPGSFSCEQISAIAWNVSLEMENVQL